MSTETDPTAQPAPQPKPAVELSAASRSTQWHQLLGTLLELLLTPVGITVQTEVAITSEPPRADILLLRRESARWTEAQRALLPAGIRDTLAQHVLLEFKYTESLTLEALRQAVGYDYFYGRAQRLKDHELATFILCSKTPKAERLAAWGYERVAPGVYRSTQPLLARVGLLLLNELPAAEHNAFVKVFASRQRARSEAFERLDKGREPALLETYLLGLRRKLLQGEDVMSTEITPKEIFELGEGVRRRIIETAAPDDLGEGVRRRIIETATPEERLAGLELGEAGRRIIETATPEDLGEGVRRRIIETATPEERLAGLTPDELALLREQLDAFFQSPAANVDEQE